MRLNTLSRRAALLCGVALLSLCPASAQKPPTPWVEGEYVLDDPAATDTIKKAIEAAVKGMWLGSDTARGRLEKTNLPPYQRISIQVGVQVTDVSITTDKREPIVTSPYGTPVDWTREDKEKLKVSTTLPIGPLKQTFKSKDGERVNTYRISADGKVLTMEVVVSSPRLPRPVTYTLVYKRASQARPGESKPPVTNKQGRDSPQ